MVVTRLLVYRYYSAITIFVSPDFRDDLGAMATAFALPATTIFVAIMHQSFLWYVPYILSPNARWFE